MLSVLRKISGFDIKILNDNSDDFPHRMTEKAAKRAALDGESADRDEQKIRAGFVLLLRVAEVTFSLENDSEQFQACEPDSMKPTIITIYEQSHEGQRAEDDHCILYMTESETNDTLVAVKALHQITYIELRQNYLVQRTIASELKNCDAQSSSLEFQLTYYNDECSLLSGSVNLAIARAGLRLLICQRNMAAGDILPKSES